MRSRSRATNQRSFSMMLSAIQPPVGSSMVSKYVVHCVSTGATAGVQLMCACVQQVQVLKAPWSAFNATYQEQSDWIKRNPCRMSAVLQAMQRGRRLPAMNVLRARQHRKHQKLADCNRFERAFIYGVYRVLHTATRTCSLHDPQAVLAFGPALLTSRRIGVSEKVVDT